MPSPLAESTSLSQTNRIFSMPNARSCMIFDARRLSRRCTTVTVRANRVRNVASSSALSPPPTTTMSCSRKKKPSQVAHQETPWPDSSFSPGIPSSRYAEPMASTTVSARYSSSPTTTSFGLPVRSTDVTSSVTKTVPNRSACDRSLSMRSGPMTPSGKPGKFSTSVVFMSAPPAVTAPSKQTGSRPARAR